MAETIVNLVLGKLADAVVQQALFLYGVRDKIERVQHDFQWIQSFLKDADAKRHKDKRVKKWVNDVQKVGYLTEDVLEKILVEVGAGRSEGLHSILRKIGKMPMNLMAKPKVVNEIDKIQQRLREIAENTKTYGMIEGLNETSSWASVKQPIRPFVNPDIDEMEVVGFEIDKKTIINQLITTNITRRSMISIVGAGGSGKTALAKDIYKSADVKRHFGISMWLTISQEYKLIDILMKMLKEIGSERQNEGEEEYLITKLNQYMRERKYLVVLDDVWSSDVWIQLKYALPDANNGSRVLITTRFFEISKVADYISESHEIQPLNEEDSIQLLLKNIFPNPFANECPNEVLPIAAQFAKICGGWPLLLVVLGGILSRKNPNYIIWDEVMQKMDWEKDISSFMGVISTSYEDLPVVLKPCFMYVGVFPEDYQIKATTLIHLWIAEGFIQQNGTKLLEDIAEYYLEELVQRGLVQVSRRSCIGKIKYCHIHAFLRNLANQKAIEDNFLTVVSKNDTKLSSSTCARRVALDGYGDKRIEHACQKKIRSLINFKDVPNFSRFETLRILHISPVPGRYLYGTNCLKGLSAMTALKYFGLQGYYGSFCNFPTLSYFKRSPLTYMKNLQTVRSWYCKSHGELPSSFWGNKQLRHINLSCCLQCEAMLEGPPSTADLQNLLTLKGVRARQDWVTKLPKFPYLRKLGIDIPEDVAGEPLMNSLSNLNHLGSLYLHMEGGNCRMTFPDCISAFRNHNNLYSFSLWEGRWPRKEIGDCTMFPPHLVKLTLRKFGFEEDPLPQLEKLPNLRVLNLWRSSMEAAEGKQMICSRGGFGRLQRLELFVGGLEEWKIEEGAMVMLNQLSTGCKNLQIVPDLQYLVNLQEFTVDCTDEFKFRLQGEDQWKIKHIPSVKYNEAS